MEKRGGAWPLTSHGGPSTKRKEKGGAVKGGEDKINGVRRKESKPTMSERKIENTLPLFAQGCSYTNWN